MKLLEVVSIMAEDVRKGESREDRIRRLAKLTIQADRIRSSNVRENVHRDAHEMLEGTDFGRLGEKYPISKEQFQSYKSLLSALDQIRIYSNGGNGGSENLSDEAKAKKLINELERKGLSSLAGLLRDAHTVFAVQARDENTLVGGLSDVLEREIIRGDEYIPEVREEEESVEEGG